SQPINLSSTCVAAVVPDPRDRRRREATEAVTIPGWEAVGFGCSGAQDFRCRCRLRVSMSEACRSSLITLGARPLSCLRVMIGYCSGNACCRKVAENKPRVLDSHLRR
ncbi:unnamed protein product, partial [Ectocarpus sp. 13 AM-2016]